MKAIRSFDEASELEMLLSAEVAERRVLQQRLRLLEGYVEAFLTSAPIGFAVVDSALRYIQINEALARMNGLPVQEHLGKTIHEILPHLASMVEPTLRRVLANGEPELNVELTDEPVSHGSARKWLGSFIPLPGLDGRPSGIGALIIDVTGYEQTEVALSETDAKYRMLMLQSSDVILVFDRHGNIVEASPKVYDMFGYEQEEMLKLNVRDLIPSQDLESAPIRFDDLLAGRMVHRERRLLRKDGSTVYVQITGSMVAEGRMLSIIRANTARKQPQAAELERGPESNSAHALSNFSGDPLSSFRAKLLKDISSALAMAAEAIEQTQFPNRAAEPDISKGIDFYDEVSRFESSLIARALRQTGGKQKEAARLLGVKQTTLHAMIKRHKIKISELQ